MLCATIRQVSAKPDTVSAMTVVDDNYTGHVDPQTAARRTLPGASIVKVSVGPMDNNAYLVTCSQTGETLLIDAANDAEILLELIERFAPKLSLIVTSHQHSGPLAGAGPGGQGHRGADRRPPARRRAASGQARPLSWPTATPSQSASCRSTSSTCRATPRARWLWRSTAPTRRRTCSPATACSPAASARPGRKATSSSCSTTSPAGCSTSTATRRSSIRATATTPRSATERPHLNEWKERGW